MKNRFGVVADDTIRKEFKKARCRVMRDPDVREYLHNRPIVWTNIRIAFWRINPTASKNLKEIKDRGVRGYKRLVDEQILSLDDTVKQFAKSHSTLDYCDEKPSLLCKYMPKGHAVNNILSSVTKFGSVGEYRRDDDMECKLPIAPEMNTDDFLDIVRARILKAILEEQNLDIISIWNNVQDMMENNIFIGSFSDGKNPEYMWHKYAKDDGVCVWFEPDYTKLKLVVYSDYLAEADNLRNQYSQMMLRIAKDGFDSFKDDLESSTREIVSLSHMSFYTKKPEFDKETEWRQLVSCSEPSKIKLDEDGYKFIVEPIPGRIVKIESRLPEKEHNRLIAEINSNIKVTETKSNIAS